MNNTRLFVRDAWGCVLRALPLAWFDRLRLDFQHMTTGSPAWRRRRQVLRLLRYRSLTDGPNTFIIQAGAPWRLANDGSLISRCLYWLGEEGHEPEVAQWWARCCKQARGVLEIGCNIGYMTLRGASAVPAGVHYIAAEPNPAALSSLKQNLAINQLDNVRVLEAAVVGTSDEKTMTLCISTLDTYNAPAGTHLAKVAAPAAHERTIDVPVVGISELLNGIDTLKLDVEGAELDILSAARKTLARQRAVLLVEVLDDAHALKEFLSVFAREEGYRLLVIGSALVETTPDKLPELNLWQTHGSRDLLVLPAERSLEYGIHPLFS